MVQVGIFAGGKDTKEGRQTVFLTALDPQGLWTRGGVSRFIETTKGTMQKASGNFQDAIYWINLRRAQDKGLTFWQTWSHAVIFYDSVPADCIEKVVITKNEEILYQRIPIPRPPPWKCGERSLASTARQRIKAANRHREIDRGTWKSIQNRLPSARSTTWSSTWRSRTHDHDPTVGAHSQNSFRDTVFDHRSTEKLV